MNAGDCRSRVTKVASGLDIHHHESGEGTPLVFLHGGGPGASGLSNFQGNHAYFARRGYRVLMPDLPGWGQSSKPAGVKYNYELLCGSLVEWMQSLGIGECDLAGNAMGGAVALRLALDRPALVRSLVLIAPAAIGDPESYLPMPGLQALIGLVRGPRPIPVESMRSLFRLMLHDPADIDDAVVAERTRAANTQAPDLFANLDLRNLKDRLHEIKAPTLLFWGASDQFCPLESSVHFLRQCPSSRLVALAACGHWVHVEKADVFNRMAHDFLQNR